MQLFFKAAFEYYQEHINRTEFFELLDSHGLKSTGSVPSIAWELFGSILTGKLGTSGYGADLEGIEIKSAIVGSSFEYQYHLNTGLEKLKEDMKVDHFFCSYSRDYKSFQVNFLKGEKLAPYFEKWIPKYLTNYNKIEGDVPPTARLQRFRRSIPYGFVIKNGRQVMKVDEGLMVYTD